jgi:hypothetical protein
MGLVKLEARNRVEQKKLRNSVFLGTSEKRQDARNTLLSRQLCDKHHTKFGPDPILSGFFVEFRKNPLVSQS